ncbi:MULTISPECIES: hypothetical protein [Flammeovirga]|uniref:Uncharacterized protein n=1 Tax=Flammeovirga agarivorans TaxID=2726742 RepID=A0A7X8XWY7_9BACT|nr:MULTISPECIES: hypothetical protein [Flammeovirga]NLR92555.1 hypothetical protein [Flammeovirga agarivorans]
MDSIQEIIFSIIGVGVYWFLSNLGKKSEKKKPHQNITSQNIVPPKEEEFVEKEDYPEEFQKQPSSTQAPASFKDLLNILIDPGKIQEQQRQLNPLDPERAEEELREDLRDYNPTNVSPLRRNNSPVDDDDYNWKDDYVVDDIEEERKERRKKRNAKPKKKKAKKDISGLFKSPNRIRDAFIMNEILHKKYD